MAGPLFTRTGDQGQTQLGPGHRVSKAHPLIELYGQLDELNSFLGLARSWAPQELAPLLAQVQDQLLCWGGWLFQCQASKPIPLPQARTEAWVRSLEEQIRQWEEAVSLPRQFVLPGGSPPAALLDVARAVARGCERQAVLVLEQAQVPAATLSVLRPLVVYLNRLSDWLFAAARWANAQLGQPELPWSGLPEAGP